MNHPANADPRPSSTGDGSLLRALLADPEPPPYAVLVRAPFPAPGGDGPDLAEEPTVEVMTGRVVDVDRLADVPLPPVTAGASPAQVLALVPYRQVRERGFECHDDDAPLRCLVVTRHEVLTRAQLVQALPDAAVAVRDGGFDLDDEAYAGVVTQVVRDEIGRGEGSNFVVRRDYRGRYDGSRATAGPALLRRLVLGEPGATWTFLVHTPGLTAVGASPERHVSVVDGAVTMNPIAGTFRYPATGPTREGLLRFLADPKEVEELYMVVDEELKMMSRACSSGGRVHGPRVRPMAHLAHTEYVLHGRTDLDVREVLRHTMFAPTVTGSPVRNAARVIRRHEATARGYYSAVAALFGQDAAGRRTLDAPILIRTAYLDDEGLITVPVGATLVRHSVPEHEVAETHAKARAVLHALGTDPAGDRTPVAGPPRAGATTVRALLADPEVRDVLAARNATLAPFWMREQQDREHADLGGRSVLVVDAEDDWTAMLAHLLRRLGASVVVVGWDEVTDQAVLTADLLVAGPGPGDPRDLGDPRIAALRSVMRLRRHAGSPLLAVCLSHQVLAVDLGLTVDRLAEPDQGIQRTVDLFGRTARVGFYNTFVVRPPAEASPGVELAVDDAGRQVHALRGPGLASVQFHLESVLSTDGVDVLASMLRDLMDGADPARRAPGPVAARSGTPGAGPSVA